MSNDYRVYEVFFALHRLKSYEMLQLSVFFLFQQSTLVIDLVLKEYFKHKKNSINSIFIFTSNINVKKNRTYTVF